MKTHTITTKASTIVPGGILALSLAVVLLAATASTASASRGLSVWNCPPLPTQTTTFEQIPEGCLGHPIRRTFDFGPRQVGTTSPAQRWALGVYNTDTLTPKISVSGNYAQTNNCPPTLSAGAPPQIAGCLITVTFTPTGTGSRHGKLRTGPGGPTVALTGYGVPAPTGVDNVKPDLQVSAKKKQNPQADGPICDSDLCEVIVKVSCPDAACTASAKGKLTKVKKDKLSPYHSEVVEPRKKATVGLELTKSQRKQARKALAEGKKVKAKITVKARDAAGNVATEKRTIKLVKHV